VISSKVFRAILLRYCEILHTPNKELHLDVDSRTLKIVTRTVALQYLYERQAQSN
jgi:hypothetical protein